MSAVSTQKKVSLNKILIANRGEIAVRVIRTARNLGYRTVAVYSDADTNALHVQEADEAVYIGASAVNKSYLSADKILAAAAHSGADAIHPGYGFLSENAVFAKACEAAGITFIGPSADAIELMGSKRLSKIAMLEAGVPCIPGYQGADQDDELLIAKATEIGVPVMVKASAGGGGRGMRLVESLGQLAEQIKTARSEAIGAFGSGELILEKAVIEPRHIEIQVFADQQGNVVYLGERDCSIQRRHQKVVEEAPSPFVDASLRQCMGEAAVNAAKSCQYRGAGTVEFLVDKDKNFYFLEMNTRLQVEHPVTELITGQDLVEWQLNVAAGKSLPLTQEQIRYQGHAIEVRLYAEDPRDNFMPQTGDVHYWYVPERDGLRVDSGIQTGSTVSAFYDPMLAKVIAYGDNREIAARRLAVALQDIQLLGVNHNKLFLQRVLQTPAFLNADVTTAFIPQYFADDSCMRADAPPAATLATAAALLFRQGNSGLYHWSSAAPAGFFCDLEWRGDIYRMALEVTGDKNAGNQYQITVSAVEPSDKEKTAPQDVALSLKAENKFSSRLDIANRQQKIYHHISKDTIFLDDGNGHYHFNIVTYRSAQSEVAGGSGQLKAVMDGAIIEVLVNKGDSVEQGQTLAVMEAMKMEHQLKAGVSGVVESLSISVGQQVKTRQLLLSIQATASKE